jgi:streptogramin lyase
VGRDSSGDVRRHRLLALIGTAAAIATLAWALELAGLFSDDDLTRRPPASGATELESRAPEGGREDGPVRETIEIGGRPTAIAAGEGGVWIADAFSARASGLDPAAGGAPATSRFALAGPAADVAAGEGGVWYALPEQGAVERREPGAPDSGGEQIPVDGSPSRISAGEGSVWVVSASILTRVDPASGEVTDEIALGGFGSALAVGGGAVWVVVDNRELVRVDAATGEAADEAIDVPDALGVAVGGGSAWVVSGSGDVTRIDLDSLGATAAPARVRGAVGIAAGEGGVWVTSLDRSVTRIDPATGEIVGDAMQVGDEPASVTVGEGAVWVANGGDGTVTRIEP